MNNKLCATGSGMSRKSWWLWSGLGLLSLYTLLLVSRCSPIEQDIQTRTNAALSVKGYGWAQASLEDRGRDTRLSGIAPNENLRNEAVQTAASVYGARVVTHDMTLKQYDSPTFSLSNNDGKTTLTGSFPDQGLIDKTVRAASDHFGAENVVNRMKLSDDVSSPAWLASSLAIFPTITGMKDAVFHISNKGSTLKGTFHTDDERQSFLKVAGEKLGDTLQETTVVIPPGPTPEELAEIARKAEEAEAARIAEEKRLAEEAEAARIAEEKRLAEEAEAARIAEEKRLAEEAEAARIAEEKRLAEEAEAARLAEEKRLAEEAEAARLAEEKRLAEEAEAARIAEEKRLAEEAEAARIAEEKRLAEEAEAARLAEEKRLAEEAEAARIAEEKRLAEEQRRAAEIAAKQKRLEQVQSCQRQINAVMDGNTILFATSSAQINRKSYPLLKAMSTAVKRCGDMVLANAQRIEISGHTDSRGSEEMNLKLSDDRAQAVRNYLLDNGVRASVLISKGYGESNPIADNNTAAGRRQNRRIQFTIQ